MLHNCRYILQVLLATPTKTGVKFAKKQQIITFKSPEKNSQTAQGATKKVLITSNPTQNVILKTTAPPKTGQVSSVLSSCTKLLL